MRRPYAVTLGNFPIPSHIIRQNPFSHTRTESATLDWSHTFLHVGWYVLPLQCWIARRGYRRMCALSTLSIAPIFSQVIRKQLCGTKCWTCTVVRRDRAVSSMVTHGHLELLRLLEWRNQLMTIREDPTCRCPFRRNGARGLGPLTLAARRKLLKSY
jgi:hypothetical protein